MCLMMPTTFGMGFMIHGMFTPYAGPGSYGHPGAGGSVAFAQPERELAFAYVMNQMAANLAGDLVPSGSSTLPLPSPTRSDSHLVRGYRGPRNHHSPRAHAIINSTTAAIT